MNFYLNNIVLLVYYNKYQLAKELSTQETSVAKSKEMSNTAVTVKEILESAAKYGKDNVLTWDPLVFRDNKKQNKLAKFDCTWIPFKFKPVSGEEKRLNLKFSKVVTGSGAKVPQSADEVKNLIIVFKKMVVEDIAAGDNVPLKKDSAEAQAVEDKRMASSVSDMLKATNEFEAALEIIDLSYRKVCQEMKDAKTLGFVIRKDKTKKTNADITIGTIRQTSREDRENQGEEIKLEDPLTRIKLMIDPKTGIVGNDVWVNKVKTFKPNVYNTRKMTAKNDYAEVLATVTQGGKRCPLDKDNASDFITYRSVVGGIIEFPEIVISKFGFSLGNKFKELYVRRNKSVSTNSAFSKSELAEFGGEDEDEDDDEVEIESTVSKVQNKFAKSTIADNGGVDDLEDLDNSDLEDAAEEDSD